MEHFYARVWEFVVAVVGGYLALKNAPKLRKQDAAIMLAVAVVVGFAAAPAIVAYVVTSGYVDAKFADKLQPLAIFLASALSLRATGWMFRVLQRSRQDGSK